MISKFINWFKKFFKKKEQRVISLTDFIKENNLRVLRVIEKPNGIVHVKFRREK